MVLNIIVIKVDDMDRINGLVSRYAPDFKLSLFYRNKRNLLQRFSRTFKSSRNSTNLVYRIPCSDSNCKLNIGETGRTLKIRIQEHKRNVQNVNLKMGTSAIHDNYSQTSHIPNFDATNSF